MKKENSWLMKYPLLLMSDSLKQPRYARYTVLLFSSPYSPYFPWENQVDGQECFKTDKGIIQNKYSTH